jgi:hypothetical protein
LAKVNIPNKKHKSIYNSTQTYLRLKQFRKNLTSNMDNTNAAAARLETSTNNILNSLKDVKGGNSEELIIRLNDLMNKILIPGRGNFNQAAFKIKLANWNNAFDEWLDATSCLPDSRPCKEYDLEEWTKFMSELDTVDKFGPGPK